MKVQAVSLATNPLKAVKNNDVKTAKTSTKDVKQKIDEKQNENLAIELDYIGKQLKTMLDLKAGKNVKVEKFANKLPEDELKTPAQKQKDEVIVSLGYIGDVLHKMSEVSSGKDVEAANKPKTKGQNR